MSNHPYTREAVERWQQGKTNVFDALAELEDQRDKALEELDEWRDSAKFVEEPPHDEVHCGCVPVLRKLLTDARRERDAAQAECEEQARLLGKSAEREDILRTKAEQQKQEILKYTKVLEDIRAGYEGTCYACEPAGELNVEYRNAVRELIRSMEAGDSIQECIEILKDLAAE